MSRSTSRFLPPPIHWLLCLAFISTPIPAATLNLTPIQDATLYEDAAGSAANGAGEFLLIGRTNQTVNSRRRGLLSFDLTCLPPGAIVTSAALQMHLELVSTADVNVSLHTVTTFWTAGPSDPSGNESSGVTAVLGDSTWLHANKPTLWNTPGGDFNIKPSATTLVTNAVGYFQWTGDAILADVLQWQADPTKNFGWLIAANETVGQTAKRFDSTNSATVEFRPSLILQYSYIPEPSSTLLYLSAATAIAGRRSRYRVGDV